MQHYVLSSLNFSDINDDELDRHTTKLSKDFPFCGEGMKFFLNGRSIMVQSMRRRENIHREDQKEM